MKQRISEDTKYYQNKIKNMIAISVSKELQLQHKLNANKMTIQT